MATILRRVLFFAALIIIWETIARINDVYQFATPMMFPSPIGVAQQLYIGFFDSGILLVALQASILRVAVGFGLAVIIGSMLGILLARFKWADETLGSLVIALQSIPSIVWLPIVMLALGTGTASVVFVVALGGTWAMTLNMRMGIKNVDPLLVKAARTMDYKGADLVWRVMIPASIPSALTGVRLAWAFGWRALMAAELLASGGLGRTLLDAKDFFNMDLVVAIMVIISVIGLIVEYLIFNKIEKRVLSRWGYAK